MVNMNPLGGVNPYAGTQNIPLPSQGGPQAPSQQGQVPAPAQGNGAQNQQAFQVNITAEARALLAADPSSQAPPPESPPQTQNPSPGLDVLA